MAVNIHPLADFIVAVAEAAETKTASGLYLPEKSQEKPKTAKVVAVGPGRVGDDNERIPTEVQVGDRIIYGGYSVTTVKQDGTEYMIIPEKDIYAIIK